MNADLADFENYWHSSCTADKNGESIGIIYGKNTGTIPL